MNKRTTKSSGITISMLVSIIVLTGCTTSHRFQSPLVLPDDRQDIPQPEPRVIYIAEDTFEYGFMRPTERIFDLSRHLRKLAGNPKQALNIDAFGGVADSSWFTNRNALKAMTLDEIKRGPATGSGPDHSGFWIISSAKTEGFTPGFNITDPKGVKYVIKFDPYGFSELSSGAEIITSKIFYAAGYNVPENYIVYFKPEILQMGESCIMYDEYGLQCEMTKEDFQQLLQKIEILPDGRYRAVASKYISGRPLGGFRYIGTRADDPNDIVPHEHRRELRGLYVMCAWLKHFDIKDANTLDTYVEANGRGYVKHYLIDFGSTLGSTTMGPMAAFRGHETEFDAGTALGNLIKLGLHVKSWEKTGEVAYPSIGRYEAFDFNPGSTKMNYSNPAIINLTNLDGYWGAKLVMSFSDEQLQVLVREGQYSDPAAETYLLNTLIRRRDMTGRYWFRRVNPLDHFKISSAANEQQWLDFTDLGIKHDFWSIEQTRYRYTLHFNNKKIKENMQFSDLSSLLLNKLVEHVRNHDVGKELSSNSSHWEISLQVSRNNGKKWSKWVKVYCRRDPQSGKFHLLGIKRQN